jgi:hypothetical protein
MTNNKQISKPAAVVPGPIYSMRGIYWPGRFGFVWSGISGVLQVTNKSLVFVDKQQNKITTIPICDIKSARFNFGKRDYLKIIKADDTHCFFALLASGGASQRAAAYAVLDQMLQQNTGDIDAVVAGHIKKSVKLQRFFWISYFFRKHR